MLQFCREAWYKKIGFVGHEGQMLLLNNADDPVIRFYVFVCGRRWGKSLVAARMAEPTLLLPGKRVWVVSPTYNQANLVCREIRASIVEGVMKENGWKLRRDSRTAPLVMEFPWHDDKGQYTILEGKSATVPDSLRGEELDLLIVDEAAMLNRSLWEYALRPTVSSRNGKVVFITTPKGYNWLYDLWTRGHDRAAFPEWMSYQGASWENPFTPTLDIEEARRTLSEAAFDQEYGAKFTTYLGQVYKEFDEGIHVMPAAEMDALIQPDWPRYRTIDFGYENPFVCLYVAKDPSDRFYIYKEYYQQHRTVEHHADKLNQQADREYEFTTADPSGASERATLLEKGIPTVAVRSDVLHGLEAVRKALKVRDDGKPGLYVSSKCICTKKEFNLYHYPEKGNIEAPAKEHDHAMDAIRYFIVNWQRGYTRHVVGVYA